MCKLRNGRRAVDLLGAVRYPMGRVGPFTVAALRLNNAKELS